MRKGSKKEKKQGKPLKLTPAQVEVLTEARIREGLTWKQLTVRYVELEGAEASIEWRTIRNAVMKDAGMALLPRRVNKQVQARIDEVFEATDVNKMVCIAFSAKFAEWSVYNDRLQYMLAAEAAKDSKEELEDEDAPKIIWDKEDQKRMDKLWDDVMSFFFRMKDVIGTINGGIADRRNAAADSSGEEGTGRRSLEEIRVIVEEKSEYIANRTLKMLEAVNARHKEEGLGHYRPRPEVVESLE